MLFVPCKRRKLCLSMLFCWDLPAVPVSSIFFLARKSVLCVPNCFLISLTCPVCEGGKIYVKMDPFIVWYKGVVHVNSGWQSCSLIAKLQFNYAAEPCQMPIKTSIPLQPAGILYVPPMSQQMTVEIFWCFQ